jgi:3-oxoacyl-[acyl-carrier protein] reductase
MKAVMITGASTGIGRALAFRLAAEGVAVAIGARRVEALAETADLIRAEGGRVFAHPLDVRNPTSVTAFVTAARSDLGVIDAVVNNAGIAVPGDIATVDPEATRSVLETNIYGALIVTQAIIADLLERDLPGDVVFISSDSVHNARPSMVSYSASKAAVEHIAQGLAYELEGRDIRVMTVRVGPTITDFASDWGDPEEFLEMVRRWRRFGNQRTFDALEPSVIADAIAHGLLAPRTTSHTLMEVQPHPPRFDVD